MKYIVITGTSSGIGFTSIQYFIDKGYYVFGCVREEKDAERLASIYTKNFTPIIFDLRDEAAIYAGAKKVKAVIGDNNLFGLINNAANVVPGPLALVTPEDMQFQFEVNVFGTINVIKAFLPLLAPTTTEKAGRVLVVTSISAEIAMPFLGLYSASKRALSSVVHTLRREFMLYGIDVIEIMPGRVKTGIADKLLKFMDRYKRTDYEMPMEKRKESGMKMRDAGLEPIELSKVMYRALTARWPKTRYVKPDLYWRGWKIPMSLPLRYVDKVLAKQMHLLPQFLKR